VEPQGPPTAAVPAARERRPVAVTLVAVLTLIVGAYGIGHGILVLVRGGSASFLAEGAFDLVLSAFGVAIGVAALRMRRWSWVALMSWALVGLVHQLLRRFFYDNPDYLSMALDTVVVLVLTPLDVQIAFRARPPRNVALESRHPVELD
jgi:hypothetical protein